MDLFLSHFFFVLSVICLQAHTQTRARAHTHTQSSIVEIQQSQKITIRGDQKQSILSKAYIASLVFDDACTL
jgi:hypothetical protein